MNNIQIKISKVIEELSGYINDLIVNREDTLGLSIALVNDTGILWAEGFGYTDQTKNEKVTAETLFSTQSIGKCFTATAFLILASKGLINLDDPIRKYFPEFTINTIHENPEEEISKITFRRMLSHTAGFTHEALIGNNYDYSECIFEEHIQSILKGWLKSPVGSEISYSNIGYDLVGYILGLIRSNTFVEVMKEELFQPIEMTTATYDIAVAQKKSFARGFDGKFAYPLVQIPMLGAGGIFISVLDAAKLISFHLRKGSNKGEQLINPELFNEMYKPQFKSGKEFGYGFGLYSVERKEGAKVYGHSGGGYGYQTIMIWIPDFKIGVAVLSNNMKQSRVGSIARKALDLMIKDILEIEKESSISRKFKLFEGTYCADPNLAPQLIRIACEKEKLYLYYTDGERIELFQKNSSIFYSENGITYTFRLNESEHPISVYVDDPAFPYTAKYNDGPTDGVGPDLKEWQKYLGIYQFQDEGRPNYLGVTIKSGFLYLIFKDNLKLFHHQSNLYFTADGEAVLFGNGELNYKGITTTKVAFDVKQIIDVVAKNENKTDYYSNAISSLIPIIYTIKDFKSSIDFIEKIVNIDNEFKENFTFFGKLLFSQGQLDEATNCFNKSLEYNSENKVVEKYLTLIQQIKGK